MFGNISFQKFRSRTEHPVKVHVWAGISHRGASKAVIFSGKLRMDSAMYMEILQKGYVPFAREKYPNGNCLLVEDNDPKHKSKYSERKKNLLAIRNLDWPPGPVTHNHATPHHPQLPFT